MAVCRQQAAFFSKGGDEMSEYIKTAVASEVIKYRKDTDIKKAIEKVRYSEQVKESVPDMIGRNKEGITSDKLIKMEYKNAGISSGNNKAMPGKGTYVRKKNINPIKVISGSISGMITDKLLLGAVVIFIPLMLLISLSLDNHNRTERRGTVRTVFPNAVESWRNVAEERLELHLSGSEHEEDVQWLTGVILAIIWQESDGNPAGPGVNGDIMQCRESGYWSYGIPDDWDRLSIPEKSIDAGVRYLIECMDAWGVTDQNDTDSLQMIVQGYNFGVAFLYYARSRGETLWSYELALSYAERMGGNYGNPRYGEQWLEKYLSAVSNGSWLWPMPASHQISSGFGERWGSTHRGIDIPCPEGSDVIASNSGTVVYVGWYSTGGNAVLVDCGEGVTNYYYHLSGFNVSPGAYVTAGDIIAFSGNTGNSTGPHLHYGVSINGEYVDPMRYLN